VRHYLDIANRYARGVFNGRILACEYVRLACERHLRDLESQKKRRYPWRMDAKIADRVCAFIENLPHVKGVWAGRGERILLSPWQVFIVVSLFGWVDRKTAKRRFREAYIEVPRKNGKSLLFACIGLAMLLIDGEHGAEVYSGATSEKQAWEIFRPALQIVRRCYDLQQTFGIVPTASALTLPKDGGRFVPVIGNPGDGASPSAALIDEYHEHTTADLYETMITGMGAREQPLCGIITTSGTDLGGPCRERHNHIVEVLEGRAKDDRTFGLIYTIDDGDDWTSEEAIRKANPNYGVSVFAGYLRDRQTQAMKNPSRQGVFKTKHLDIWVGAKANWLNMLDWKRCGARLPLEQLRGRPCFLGLDLATRDDLAAMVAVWPAWHEDPLWHVHGWYYVPEDSIDETRSGNGKRYRDWVGQGVLTATPGNVIDYDCIMEDLRGVLKSHAPQQIGFDPWQATHMASTMLAERAPMIEVRQTVAMLSEPMKETGSVIRQGKLAHGGCPILTWMAGNVIAKMDKKDNIYPDKERPPNKIDGIVALIIAMNRALASPKARQSVYETRGLTVL
jgi:phage terminase large subunit-like protein